MKSITKPVVLTGFGCAFCLYILLCGYFSSAATAAICILTSLILAGLCFFTHGKSACILLSVCIAVCVMSGIIQRNVYEKSAVSFIENHFDSQDTVYCARITSCKSYGLYNNAHASIISVDGKETTQDFGCRLGFYSDEPIEEGNIVYFTGTPAFPSNDDSDGFDNVSYLRSRKIFIDFPSCTVTQTDEGSPPLTKNIHKYIENILYKYIPDDFNFEPADVSYSMLLGDKAFLSDDVKEAFTNSGIIHLLCVSGMHLSIIMGAVYCFFKVTGLGRRISCILLIGFCLAYLAIIGFPISAVRAGIICIIGYCATLLGRNTDGYSSLFAAATIICMFSPYSVLDISAQLSFLSSLGIITMTELLINGKKNSKSASNGMFTTIKFLLAANIGAVSFTYLISANAFGGISLMSVPATLLTSFVSEILLVFLLITIILSLIPFLQPALWFTGFICRVCAGFIINVAKFFSSFRYSYTTVSNILPWLIVFLIIVCLLCFFIYFDKRKAKIICVVSSAVICIAMMTFSLYNAMKDDSVYKISYFRQNTDDRQVSIKLATNGFLIINADDTLCTNPDKADFDSKDGANYLLIIPEDSINSGILAENIENFNLLYGIKGVFVPNTQDGKELMASLERQGCKAAFIDSTLDFGTFMIEFRFSDTGTYFSVDDSEIKTGVLFSDEYSHAVFGNDCNICAFFTKETKNQFDIQNDIPPKCETFITRLKKDEIYKNTYNTYGKKSFDIKG